MTRPLNLPAPSTRRSVYCVFRTWHRPVFLVNSRLGRFSAASRSSNSECNHPRRHPLSRSYGVNLPSSLTRVLSSALGSSPRQPVSVLVRTLNESLSLRGFSWKLLRPLRQRKWARLTPGPWCGAFDIGRPGLLQLRPPIALREWCTNINALSIDYAFRPRLRIRLTLGGFAFPRKP